MGKRGKKNKKGKKQSPAGKVASTQSTNSPPEPDLEADLNNLEEKVLAFATEEELDSLDSNPGPELDVSLKDLLVRANNALYLVSQREQRVASLKEDVQKRLSSIEDAEREFQNRSDKLNKKAEECSELETELLEREESVLARELDADADFCKRNREALKKLDAEGEEIRDEIFRRRKQIQEEWVRHAEESMNTLNSLKFEAETTFSELQEALDRERKELAIDEKRIKKEARKIAFEREILDEDRAALDELIEKRSARDVELKDRKIAMLENRLNAAREERDSFSKNLAMREDADRRFGSDSPDQVLEKMKYLEDECDNLRKKLGSLPTADAAQKLERLVREKETWESERLDFLTQLGEAKQDSARRRIAVTELESLRDQKLSLEYTSDLLREANRQLRDEVDSLIKADETKSPFPSCSAMDADVHLQVSIPVDQKIKSLPAFVESIQHGMAFDPATRKELYYSASDVRSFLGGLATSRLHLLQGISGTGKTSLPLAFARAIGAGCALVEIQAGWRDRQDLIGHFNTFEKRFYETEFLQALYRASLPAYRERPFVIVLDEMNLSHPEQYFADLLSALEQDQSHQRLVLMTAAVEPSPNLLIEKGTKLPIPPNVWFIGTANHDETTKDFADKTYDRAHVMELPRHRETFTPKAIAPTAPIGFEALQAAFDVAVEKHGSEAVKSYDFLQSQLGGVLGKRFQVGWGNRLERQMGRYVPVIVSAGGTVGEATDHILATKLIRKIRDRHDNRPEDILMLRDRIQSEWSQLDKETAPDRSLGLLNNELRRLGHDED